MFGEVKIFSFPKQLLPMQFAENVKNSPDVVVNKDSVEDT